MPGKKKVFFPNLDALRFVAFLLVFLQHGFYGAFKPFADKGYLPNRLVSTFFLGGGTGVQIFFVLSGFLITYLLIVEGQERGNIDIKRFYMRRTLRIWPLYYAVVIFGFVIYPYLKGLLGIHSNLCSRPWYYFTFLANFDLIHMIETCPGEGAMMQNIVWSVSIEEQFYLFWPLLFVVFPRKWQWMIFPLIIISSIVYRFNASSGAAAYFHTFSAMGDLAIGGLFAYLSLKSNRFLHFLHELPRKWIALIYTAIVLMYLFADRVFIFPGVTLVGWMIFDLFWVFIIMEQCFANHKLFPLGKIRVFSGLGKVSYGLYMLHPIGILIVDISFRVLHISATSFGMLILQGVLSFICSIILARLSFRWFEMPFLRIKERFAIVRTPAAEIK